MSHYCNSTIQTYLDDLAAKTPTPGGGSAAALAAALGTALISMAAQYTIGKPAYAHYETQIKEILEKSEKCRVEFLRMVDLDCAAYQSGDCRDAMNVPFMVARLCCEAIQLCPYLAAKGNKNLISDAGVAAVLLEAAFASSFINVRINLRTSEDKKLCRGIVRELSQKEKKVKQARIKTEEAVGALIGG